jgi:uncharacterized protein
VELTLFVDHDCNLRCDYCYGGRKLARPMPTEVMKGAVDWALATHTDELVISFFGGEPLLHPDFIADAVAYVEERAASLDRPPRVSFGMNTNGTRFDAQALRLLAPPRRWTIFVSLDGPADIHDMHRRRPDGRGSHATVTAGLALLRRDAIPFTLVAVVRPDNAGRLGDVLQALLDQEPAAATLTPDLRAPWTDEDVTHLRSGLAELADVWAGCFRRGRPIVVEPLHTKILTHLYGGLPCPARCTLAGEAVAVAPSGRLYPCAQMVAEDKGDTLVIGTAFAGLDRNKLAELQQQKDRIEASCADCALASRCQSHCGCWHWALTGELGRINATLCELEESFIAAADRAAAALMAEGCASFVATYYRQRYTRSIGSTVTRLEPPGRR